MDTFDVKLYFLDYGLRDIYPLIRNYITLYTLINDPPNEYHMCDFTISIQYANCNYSYYNWRDNNYIGTYEIKCTTKLYECFMNELLWRASMITFKEYLHQEFENSLIAVHTMHSYKSFLRENHYVSLIVKYIRDRVFSIEHHHVHTGVDILNIFSWICENFYSDVALKMTQLGTKWHNLISFDVQLGKLLIDMNKVSYDRLFDILPTDLVI